MWKVLYSCWWLNTGCRADNFKFLKCYHSDNIFIHFRLNEFENELESGNAKLHDDVQRAAQELVDSLADPKTKKKEVSRGGGCWENVEGDHRFIYVSSLLRKQN